MVSLLVVAGTRARHLIVLALVGTVAIFGAFQLHIIKQYQLDRLSSFLDTSHSSETATYNLNQSLIAIGAGGITGTGYLKGTQTNPTSSPSSTPTSSSRWSARSWASWAEVVSLLLFVSSCVLWIATQATDRSHLPATGIAPCSPCRAVSVGMTMESCRYRYSAALRLYRGSALIADFIAVGCC
jgi:rod shape determining protein RodA